MKKYINLFAGFFFILTSYTGMTLDMRPGNYSKVVVGGFSKLDECEASAANFPAPQQTVTQHCWWFGTSPCVWEKPYNEASQCYSGTPK